MADWPGSTSVLTGCRGDARVHSNRIESDPSTQTRSGNSLRPPVKDLRSPGPVASVIRVGWRSGRIPGSGKTVGETIDDATITTRVKTAMLNDPAVGGLRIDVDTFKGVVTLSGRVKSQAERDRAMMLARGISGVVEVKDTLQVIPENNP